MTPTLPVLQSRIGRWAIETFGPTPSAVHAARMDREMADIHDCIATGNMDALGRTIAGVLVVALALADSADIDLTAALMAEQAENEASQWQQDSWGQWMRNGDGSVSETQTARMIAKLVGGGSVTPREGVAILCALGASFPAARAYLIAAGAAAPEDFHAQRMDDLVPARRLVPPLRPAGEDGRTVITIAPADALGADMAWTTPETDAG